MPDVLVGSVRSVTAEDLRNERRSASDAHAEPSDEASAPNDVPDAAMERLLRGVLVILGVTVVAALVAGGVVWLLRDDPQQEPMNAVDVGFLQDMIDHHQQAVLISELYLADDPDGGAAPYAREVILFQERELGWMRDWLAEEGYAPGAADRTAMEWMGMGMPVPMMAGMQSQDRLDELAAATGADADRLFFVMMADHHLGGVEMADYEVANGQRRDIIDFAEAVARNQRIEVAEYSAAWDRLGLGPRADLD